MPNPDLERLRGIKTFPSLVKYLRDDLDWPIESEHFDDLTFDFEPEELGIDPKTSAKIESIKQLRPLASNQPWGIFFVKFEPKKLPVVALRRILGQLVIKKRASANRSDQQTWRLSDLLFLSNYGENEQRQITFAHFSGNGDSRNLPTLKVLGWDDSDTTLHIDHAHSTLRDKLRWPDDKGENLDAWRKTWSSAFSLRHREVIETSKELAVRLAGLAQKIRKRANSILSIEVESGPLRKLMAGFKEALIHDLTEDSFADMYAQTIAYGLLSARITNPKGNNPDELSNQMPITNPFLKELMESFLSVGGRKGKSGKGVGIDFDELGINEVVDLLDNSNMEAVVRDFGDKNPLEDPVIHFYELFLKEYDPKEKVKRGVFYTPRPVVSFIVRSVDEILRTEFGLEDGLADTVTWGEIVKRNKDFKIPKGAKPDDPFVQILDPATGTGTFLVEVIDLIHKTMFEKWEYEGNSEKKIEELWNDYVPKHLLPRLHGYELLMAPYAIAHMKIGLKLYEAGYRFGSKERTRIYLTNALEPAQDFSDRFAFAIPALAHEAESVNEIKKHQNFTVVIGNPPYSFTSQNLEEKFRVWVDPYRSINGNPIKEKGALQAEKAIQDDYIKFMRFAEWHVTKTTTGVVGVISSHGYLENPTLRGMRNSYLLEFDSIRIVDLHGNTTKKERSPDGSVDQNVFDIKQGVSIMLAARQPAHEGSIGIGFTELWGTRDSKYLMLQKHEYSSLTWVDAAPEEPFYLFKPYDNKLRKEFDGFHKITEMMPIYGVGAFTSKDHFVIGFDADKLVENAKKFRDSRETDQVLCENLGISMKAAWNVTKARELLQKDQHLESFVHSILYRPFDIRFIFYHPSLVWSMSRPTMQHLVDGRNLGLAIGRAGGAIDQGEWNIVLCANSITDLNLYRRGGNSVFPLYLKNEKSSTQGDLGLSGQPRMNFSGEFLTSLSNNLGAKPLTNGMPAGIEPEDIFQYTYAVFHSRTYRIRYGEFLKIDFPRLPLPRGLDFFRNLAHRGGQLVALHLMESQKLKDYHTNLVASGDFRVEKVSYSDETVFIDKAKNTGFKGVLQEVWDFQVGGYQICHKWLKDRGPKKGQPGRVLTEEDIDHYQKIIIAISETIRIMGEIDEVIEEHGGWPGAFVTE